MMEIIARRDEIFFSEKTRKDLSTKELIENYRKLVEEILSYLDAKAADQIMQRPRYIETMGDSAPLSITRIVHEGEEGEPPSKDYDFSRKSIEEHIEEGYKIGRRALEGERKKKMSGGRA
jgi:NTE family protein